MTLNDITSAIEQLSDEDYTALLTWQAREENPRRDRKRVTDQSDAKLIIELRESGDLPAPQAADISTIETSESIPEWVDPGTKHANMYTLGNVVQHNEKVWESITPTLNSWEPGNDNGLTWRDITAQLQPDYDPDAPQPFVKPTGSHDAYSLGARVLFNGNVYRSLIDGNTYSPDEYPAGWELEDID